MCITLLLYGGTGPTVGCVLCIKKEKVKTLEKNSIARELRVQGEWKKVSNANWPTRARKEPYLGLAVYNLIRFKESVELTG